MKRLYCPPENVEGSRIYLDDKGAHYIKDVLRLKKGDRIEIFDGKGNKYSCILQGVNRGKIFATINSKEFSMSKEPSCRSVLAQALPSKHSKMDFIVEKATELGVDEIIPVAAERCITQALSLHKLERWQKIASEASRQCGRAKVPRIKEVLSVEDALAAFSTFDMKLFACIDKGTVCLKTILKDKDSLKDIAVFIGPEGDFTKQEINAAKENGFNLVSLGERVLRTETAGLYVLSVLDYAFS